MIEELDPDDGSTVVVFVPLRPTIEVIDLRTQHGQESEESEEAEEPDEAEEAEEPEEPEDTVRAHISQMPRRRPLVHGVLAGLTERAVSSSTSPQPPSPQPQSQKRRLIEVLGTDEYTLGANDGIGEQCLIEVLRPGGDCTVRYEEPMERGTEGTAVPTAGNGDLTDGEVMIDEVATARAGQPGDRAARRREEQLALERAIHGRCNCTASCGQYCQVWWRPSPPFLLQQFSK